MSSTFHRNTAEEVKVDSVILLLAELSQKLSEQSRWAIQNRMIYRLVILLGLAYMSLATILILLPLGFAPPEMNKLIPSLKDFYTSFPFLFYILALGFVASFTMYTWFKLAKRIFPPGVNLHACREVATTYKHCRRLLAEANSLYEHNHLEEHQRLLLEIRMGTLDAAVAHYEAVVDPIVKRSLSEEEPSK